LTRLQCSGELVVSQQIRVNRVDWYSAVPDGVIFHGILTVILWGINLINLIVLLETS
jgi:hypothetical protein